MSEKSQILDAVGGVVAPRPTNSLSPRVLLMFLLTVALALTLLFPKIYLQSQIYYKSRDIAHLKHEHNALLEENRIIKSKVEAIRFKNQILDTMFKLK